MRPSSPLKKSVGQTFQSVDRAHHPQDDSLESRSHIQVGFLEQGAMPKFPSPRLRCVMFGLGIALTFEECS